MASWEIDAGGGGTTTAAIGPEEFVRTVVSSYERSGLGVDEGVITYMVKKVVVGERRWFAGMESGRIDLGLLHSALTDALETAAKDAEDEGSLILYLVNAEKTFRQVIESRWHCPYGLWWC